PAVGMELDLTHNGRGRQAARDVLRDPGALVAAHAESLQPVAGLTLDRIPARVDRMNGDVIVAVEVERLEHTIVAAQTLILAVTVQAILLVIARNVCMVLAEAGRVRVAANGARWRQLAFGILDLHGAGRLQQVTDPAARGRLGATDVAAQ